MSRAFSGFQLFFRLCLMSSGESIRRPPRSEPTVDCWRHETTNTCHNQPPEVKQSFRVAFSMPVPARDTPGQGVARVRACALFACAVLVYYMLPYATVYRQHVNSSHLHLGSLLQFTITAQDLDHSTLAYVRGRASKGYAGASVLCAVFARGGVKSCRDVLVTGG